MILWMPLHWKELVLNGLDLFWCCCDRVVWCAALLLHVLYCAFFLGWNKILHLSKKEKKNESWTKTALYIHDRLKQTTGYGHDRPNWCGIEPRHNLGREPLAQASGGTCQGLNPGQKSETGIPTWGTCQGLNPGHRRERLEFPHSVLKALVFTIFYVWDDSFHSISSAVTSNALQSGNAFKRSHYGIMSSIIIIFLLLNVHVIILVHQINEVVLLFYRWINKRWSCCKTFVGESEHGSLPGRSAERFKTQTIAGYPSLSLVNLC